MKDLWKWVLRQWGLVGGALALLLLIVGTAGAQHYGGYGDGYQKPCYGPECYSTPNYHGHGYGYKASSYGGYRSQWSAWTYGPWSKDPCYFAHYRTWYDHCGVATNHNDGWLYSYVHGCYQKHCLIDEYAGKPALQPYGHVEKFSGTQVGYDPDLYCLIQKYPYLFAPGVLQSKGLPGVVSPQDFLEPGGNTGELRQTLAHKESMSAKEHALRIYEKESDRESLQDKVRGQLALVTAQGNQEERLMAEIKEIVAVVKSRAKITAELDTESVPVDDPALAAVITTSCLRCHGAAKQEGGIDFRQADRFTSDQRYAVFSAVLTGEMPKGGTALAKEKIEPFRKWYEEGLLAARR